MAFKVGKNGCSSGGEWLWAWTEWARSAARKSNINPRMGTTALAQKNAGDGGKVGGGVHRRREKIPITALARGNPKRTSR